MKKLSLDLDQLAVESFDTSEARRSMGTVRGHGLTDTTCMQMICDCPTGSGDTCEAQYCSGDTCDTCYDSCNGGCGTVSPTQGSQHTCVRPSCYNSCPGTCGALTCDVFNC